MSQKRKLESLASLGILKDRDIKRLQSRLEAPQGVSMAELWPRAQLGLLSLIGMAAGVILWQSAWIALITLQLR